MSTIMMVVHTIRFVDKKPVLFLGMVTPIRALKAAAAVISESTYMVALTGAGISRESNVPTFRGTDGLWRNYDPMELATPQAFERDPMLVWEWYSWRQGLILECEPNPAHHILAKWEKEDILGHIITQNVDDLHRRAGSKGITKLHGDIFKVKCTRCTYRAIIPAPPNGVPTCPDCESLLRPDVVWFGESLDQQVMDDVRDELNQSDVIIVIGTSGIVQPAASFPLIVKRWGEVVEVNPEETPITVIADVHVAGKAGEALPQIDQLIQR